MYLPTPTTPEQAAAHLTDEHGLRESLVATLEDPLARGAINAVKADLEQNTADIETVQEELAGLRRRQTELYERAARLASEKE